MHKFVRLNVFGHLSVVKEMSLFLLTDHVDPSEMDSLAGQVKKAEDAANKASSTLDKRDRAFRMLKQITTIS
jgi:hypothetical protein